MLIALEGIDASGKASASKILDEYLQSTGNRTTTIAFPHYDGPVGPLIKETLNTPGFKPEILQSLMLADRLSAIDILTDTTKIVICDRYYMSGIIYGTIEGLDEPWLYQMHKTLPKADIQILLDIDPLISSKRRAVPRDENEKNIDKLQAVRKKYVETWNKNSATELGIWYTINANATLETVHQDLINVFKHSQMMKSYKLSSYAAI